MENIFVDPEDLSSRIRSKKDLYDLFKFRSKSVFFAESVQSGLLDTSLVELGVVGSFYENFRFFEVLLSS